MSATNYMSELPFANLDEDSFQTLMYEHEHGLINYNFENLVNLSGSLPKSGPFIFASKNQYP